MQIKTTMRFHFTFTKMATINQNNNKCGENVERIKQPYIAGGNVKRYSYFGNSPGVPQKVKHRITICPSNSTPRYMPKRKHVNTNTCTQTFMATLFIIGQK